ncbi:uncharacterized protein HMPREF1541_06623 [Cyphellophora europaea CBS 101466]|uniref:Uncharacterized protein n=1 Tax=Cyphellophora europaea (strain CBS 101466) TaxID=1220924 RepID=W2RPY7_CYPE1|nr:uncharacterized protein HMPREF1541_06623 [Cyphellophora europaea CBS 101466]ETN38586.1 hypothetical protein HMPREF1541_06623 [Cyphellophora europaea CBS 101466]
MSSPPTKPFPFLSLPPEVRNKVYSHLLPESIGLFLNSPNKPNDAPPLDLATTHLSSPSAAFTDSPLTYTICDWRYRHTPRYLTNATRPPVRELAMTCRLAHSELLPTLLSRLHLRCESVAQACVFAARVGPSLAAEIRELTVRAPFTSLVPADTWLEADEASKEAAGREVLGWVRVLARFVPGVRVLTLHDVPRNPERREEWGTVWDPWQLPVLKEVERAWEGLVPTTGRQSGWRGGSVVVWKMEADLVEAEKGKPRKQEGDPLGDGEVRFMDFGAEWMAYLRDQDGGRDAAAAGGEASNLSRRERVVRQPWG